jgi:hypothetical protein
MIIFVSCATKGRKAANKITVLVAQGKYDEAAGMVKSKNYYPGKESRLLKLVQLGLLKNLKGEYKQSLDFFNQAQELSDQLFTVSISKKAKSFITNDVKDNYYGEKYERSAIRFYLALNHFLLFEKGTYEALPPSKKGEKGKKAKKLTTKERRFHLQAARATVMEWDSLLDSYKSVTAGKSVYKDDMAAKVFGAYIHERMNTRGDAQISRNLYKTAEKLHFRNYNGYPTYNHSYQKFRDDFDKFPNMGESKVKKEYVGATALSKQLSAFLKRRKKNKDNVSILTREGLITSKTAKKISFPIGFNTLPFALRGNKRDFITFVRKVLAISSVSAPSISFELPQVAFSKNVQVKEVVARSMDGKLVKVGPLVLVNPFSELAHVALDNKITVLRTKTGIRLVAKHMAALAAAYFAYKKALKSGQPDFMASLLASGIYALENKAIAAGEKADLRNWNTLPQNIRMARLSLPVGKFKLFSRVKGGKAEKFISMVDVQKKKKSFVSKRLF